MLAYLVRLALRLSATVPIAALVFFTLSFSTAPARADICSPILPSNFPNLGPSGNPQTTCNTIVVISPGGAVSVFHSGTQYTISGDVVVGVINNSGGSIFDLFLEGASGKPGIFNINTGGESLCATSLAPKLACGGATGDEGGIISGANVVGQNTFTGITIGNGVALNYGDILFSGGGLANGQDAIFGLAQDLCLQNSCALVSPTPVPEPGSFGVLGTGVLGFALYRFRRKRRALRLKLKHQLS